VSNPNRIRRWSQTEEARLLGLYRQGKSAAEIGSILGRTSGGIRNRCLRLGLAEKHVAWSDDELRQLRAAYERSAAGGPIGLEALGKKLGRNSHNLSRKARELGLTNMSRPKTSQPRLPLIGLERGSSEHRALISANTRAAIRRNGHPRGMLGKKHSPENIEKCKAGWRRWWEAIDPEAHQDRIERMLATRVARHGRGTAAPDEAIYSFAHRGRRADLGDIFFRSAWEANYARYLNHCIEKGVLTSWQYEPRTFVFPNQKRDVMSWTPDFIVVEAETGWERIHEVKGKWTIRFDRQLELLEQHYPEWATLMLISEDTYRDLDRWARGRIPNWEIGKAAS
jgi:hypothetical protein